MGKILKHGVRHIILWAFPSTEIPLELDGTEHVGFIDQSSVSFFLPIRSLASEDIKQKDRRDHIYVRPVFTGPEPGAGNGHRTRKPTMNVQQSGSAPF